MKLKEKRFNLRVEIEWPNGIKKWVYCPTWAVSLEKALDVVKADCKAMNCNMSDYFLPSGRLKK